MSLGSSTTTSNSISGNVPSAAVTSVTTLSIVVQVTDSASHTVTSTALSLTLYPKLTLSANLPSVQENATLTAGQDTVTVSGGSGNYSFSTLSGLPTGLTFSTSGNVASVVGTAPSTANTYNFTVVATDTATGATVGSSSDESITVSAPGATISGSISLINNCNGVNTPTVTLNMYTGSNTSGTPYATTTTTSGGNYSFSSVAAGSYTIVPSYSGTGITSVFFPSSLAITANGTTLSNQSFDASIGYTVSGTVNYTSTPTLSGWIYLNLVSTCNSSQGTAGTAISAPGIFTIAGVPPGTYTLSAWMDPSGLGQGQQNANDPTGSVAVTVNTAIVSNQIVTLNNPTFATPSENPEFTVQQIPNGVLVFYQASKNGSSIEDANAYTIEWTTTAPTSTGADSSQFSNIAGSETFKAIGANGSSVWILTNIQLAANSISTFTVGDTYYFQARSFNTEDSDSHPSGWYTDPTSVTISSSPASCSSSCTALTSSITIPSGVTVNSGAPLYEGFYQDSGSGAPTIYGTVQTSPAANNTYQYTLSVPSGSGWVPFAILDETNAGQVVVGTVTNVRDNESLGYTVSGSSQTVAGVTLPGVNSTAQIGAQYYNDTSSGGTSTGYGLQVVVDEANKLPVAVELVSGPNYMPQIDLSNQTDNGGGTAEFGEYESLYNGVTPNVGDTYTFTVTYSDSSSDTQTITGAVTGWNNGSSLVGTGSGASAQGTPYNLSPAVTASTTPNFSWSLPTSVTSSDYQQFQLDDSTTNNTIWSVPSQNGNGKTFPISYLSLTWDVDPTNNSNTSTESTLSTSDQYNWSIQVNDGYGNQAQTQTYFQP